MANTKKATDNKATKTNKATDNKEAKVMNKTEKKVEAKKETTKKVEKEAVKKENVRKTNSVKQMKNSEMKALFTENGCATYTRANDTSNVVYNTFGTKSRVLQQGRAYQLLLTNGHKKVKEQIVDCDNDDVKRFKEFYSKLSKEEQAKFIGVDMIDTVKLAESELPRERSVKVNDFDLLVKFIQFMGTFEENKITA
jgi:hypothetical protein